MKPLLPSLSARVQGLPSFLEETTPSAFGNLLLQPPVQAPVTLLYASVTKAVESVARADLMGFTDLDMGDEHFQVSEQV